MNVPVSVSVIVPVFNGGPFIERCINSLVNQSLKSIEIIVVDDLSTDNTVSLVADYASRDPRIVLLTNEENSGPAFSRNRGLEVAKGDYIGFVDADDWVEDEYFEKLYDEARSTGAEIVKGHFLTTFPSGVQTSSPMNAEIRKRMRDNQFPCIEFMYAFWNAIYSRELLSRHGITFPLLSNGEDIVFMVKAVYHARKFGVIDNASYYYFQHESSLSRSVSERYLDSIYKHVRMLQDFLDESDLPQEDYIDFFNKGIMDTLVNHHLNYLRKSDKFDAYVDGYMKFVKDTLSQFKYSQEFLMKYPSVEYQRVYYKPLPDLVKIVKNGELHLSQTSLGGSQERGPQIRTYWFRLFGILPIVKIKRAGKVTRVRLFGLNMMKITKS